MCVQLSWDHCAHIFCFPGKILELQSMNENLRVSDADREVRKLKYIVNISSLYDDIVYKEAY